MVIGHIDDLDIVTKIREYQKKCTCSTFHAKLIKAAETDVFRGMNIEVSLACNGKCAFCCVCAPEWRGVYDYYERIGVLIDALEPKELHFQGGEVLIQKNTLRWLSSIKERHPNVRVVLTTNGNVELDVLDTVESIFSELHVSIVGYQPVTYQTIMGLDFERMRRFVTHVIARRKVDVYLKYLVSPINVHECWLFVDWASSLGPQEIAFADTATRRHLNPNAPFHYWDKILERSALSLSDALVRNRERLLQHNVPVYMDAEVQHLFHISSAWIQENELGAIVRL